MELINSIPSKIKPNSNTIRSKKVKIPKSINFDLNESNKIIKLKKNNTNFNKIIKSIYGFVVFTLKKSIISYMFFDNKGMDIFYCIGPSTGGSDTEVRFQLFYPGVLNIANLDNFSETEMASPPYGQHFDDAIKIPEYNVEYRYNISEATLKTEYLKATEIIKSNLYNCIKNTQHKIYYLFNAIYLNATEVNNYNESYENDMIIDRKNSSEYILLYGLAQKFRIENILMRNIPLYESDFNVKNGDMSVLKRYFVNNSILTRVYDSIVGKYLSEFVPTIYGYCIMPSNFDNTSILEKKEFVKDLGILSSVEKKMNEKHQEDIILNIQLWKTLKDNLNILNDIKTHLNFTNKSDEYVGQSIYDFAINNAKLFNIHLKNIVFDLCCITLKFHNLQMLHGDMHIGNITITGSSKNDILKTNVGIGNFYGENYGYKIYVIDFSRSFNFGKNITDHLIRISSIYLYNSLNGKSFDGIEVAQIEVFLKKYPDLFLLTVTFIDLLQFSSSILEYLKRILTPENTKLLNRIVKICLLYNDLMNAIFEKLKDENLDTALFNDSNVKVYSGNYSQLELLIRESGVPIDDEEIMTTNKYKMLRCNETILLELFEDRLKYY